MPNLTQPEPGKEPQGPAASQGPGAQAAAVASSVAHGVAQAATHAAQQAQAATASASAFVKPKMRGWLHAGTFPLAVAAGIVIVVLSPNAQARVTTAIFSITAALLFGVSAIYHRGNWSPRAAGVLKRMDHANIFLIIAGSYTPFSVLLLPPGLAQTLLWIVWSGALAGIAFRVFWVKAPRWLYVPVYIALGWVAVVYSPAFLSTGKVAAFVMIVVGGVLYTLGAVVYGTKRPNPSPRWFGFHEIFHAFTIAAFAAHYIGLSLIVYTIKT
jgi:hemolysin III